MRAARRTPDPRRYFYVQILDSLRRSHPDIAPDTLETFASDMLDFAGAEGIRIRLRVRARRIADLRQEVGARARCGVYRRRRWQELRELEVIDGADRREHADALARRPPIPLRDRVPS